MFLFRGRSRKVRFLFKVVLGRSWVGSVKMFILGAGDLGL